MRKRRFRIMPKLVMLICLVYAAITLLMMQADLNKAKALQAKQEQQLHQQSITNTALSEAIASESGDVDIEHLAREKLGLVKPGEIVFVDVSR